jgi:hypothetical protein
MPQERIPYERPTITERNPIAPALVGLDATTSPLPIDNDT